MELFNVDKMKELEQLLFNTTQNNNDTHVNLTKLINNCCNLIDNVNKEETENDKDELEDKIPDLVTPPLSPSLKYNDVNDTLSNSFLLNSDNLDLHNDSINNDEVNDKDCDDKDCDDKDCDNSMTHNDNYNFTDLDHNIYKTTNTLMILLIMNELFHLYMNYQRASVSLLVLNTLMYLFYNSFKDTIIKEQNSMCKSVYQYTCTVLTYAKSKLDNFWQNAMDYCFSRNTQMMLKFALNMSKMYISKTFRLYKNKFWQLFNPPVLVSNVNEIVYSVSFYLNGIKYKIPVIVPCTYYGAKQPPLMVLNNKEEDIAQHIQQFMGPNNDFYNMAIRPRHLDEKSLYFMMEDGSEMTIHENDIMVM
jgi:hypothetical protein